MVRLSRKLFTIGLNFAPESTGIAPYTAGFAKGIAERGFEVQVFTSRPHYPQWKVWPESDSWKSEEAFGSLRIKRFRHYVPTPPVGLRRLLSELSFGLTTSFAKWGSNETILLVSPALISTAMAVLRARITHRKTPVVIWVQDLYSLGLGETAQGGALAESVFRKIEGWTLRQATAVVAIHERFADRISREFDVDANRIQVIRNWSHIALYPGLNRAEIRESLEWGADETVVLHTGNMGKKQGLSNVVETAKLADAKGLPLRFALLGAGSEFEALKELSVGIERIQFISPVDDQDYAGILLSADILLVNELPGVAEMAVPSKLTSYFMAGKPVIAATSENGNTAEELRISGAGIAVAAGDPAELLSAIDALRKDSAKMADLGANGRDYSTQNLSEEAALEKFEILLNRLMSASRE